MVVNVTKYKLVDGSDTIHFICVVITTTCVECGPEEMLDKHFRTKGCKTIKQLEILSLQ